MAAPRPQQSPAGPRPSARAAGLRYVTDEVAGITRQRAGAGFTYRDARGRRVRDAATLGRIRSLVIPPAWKDVWISPDPHGHLQVTGRDARGRKQYRYHPRWTEVRDGAKYSRMIGFAEALPAIRRRVLADLKQAPLSRERVLATVIRLLETTLIRVGNEEYAKANRSFGLTTLQDRHVTVRGRRREVPIPRQERRLSGDRSRGRGARPQREAVPGSAGTDAVPVSGWRRRPPERRVSRRERAIFARSAAKTSPPRISGRGRAQCWRPPRCATSTESIR